MNSTEKMAINLSGNITMSTTLDMQNNSIINTNFPNSSYEKQFMPYDGIAVLGSWAWFAATGHVNNGVFGGSGVCVIGDEYKYKVEIPAGNYTTSFLYQSANNRGKIELRLNYSSTSLLIATVDEYTAAATVNQYYTTNFSIPILADGYFVVKADNKNAASTGYCVYYTNLHIYSRK